MYRLVIYGSHAKEFDIACDLTFENKEKADSYFTEVMNKLVHTAYQTNHPVFKPRLMKNHEFREFLKDEEISMIPQIDVAQIACITFRDGLKWLKAPVDDEEFKKIK